MSALTHVLIHSNQTPNPPSGPSQDLKQRATQGDPHAMGELAGYLFEQLCKSRDPVEEWYVTYDKWNLTPYDLDCERLEEYIKAADTYEWPAAMDHVSYWLDQGFRSGDHRSLDKLIEYHVKGFHSCGVQLFKLLKEKKCAANDIYKLDLGDHEGKKCLERLAYYGSEPAAEFLFPLMEKKDTNKAIDKYVKWADSNKRQDDNSYHFWGGNCAAVRRLESLANEGNEHAKAVMETFLNPSYEARVYLFAKSGNLKAAQVLLEFYENLASDDWDSEYGVYESSDAAIRRIATVYWKTRCANLGDTDKILPMLQLFTSELAETMRADDAWEENFQELVWFRDICWNAPCIDYQALFKNILKMDEGKKFLKLMAIAWKEEEEIYPLIGEAIPE